MSAPPRLRPPVHRQIICGLGASPGCAIGAVQQILTTVELPAEEPLAADREATAAAISTVLESVAVELERRAALVDGDARDVLEATATFARDPTLVQAAARHLAEVGPAAAIHRAFGEAVDVLAAVGDYWAQRATDLLDVRDRAIARWRGLPEPGIPALSEPAILIAEDLAPADVALLDRELVLGVVIERGAPTCHAAIITSQLGIPCVVQAVGARSIPDATEIMIDGSSGQVVVAPSADDRAAVARRRDVQRRLRARPGGPGALADGTGIALYANVGTVADALHAASTGVEGVGLFRTEFLYGDREVEPSVAEQTASYAEVLAAFGDRPVTFRTLDVGADKPLPFAAQSPEVNPALGVRGLRHSQRSVELLDHQLAAIANATRVRGGTVRVMAPMVATVEESEWFVQRCARHGITDVGVMIEVPSAALRARHVLEPVAFGSLGTNDLGQYAMAADRTVGELAHLLTPWQPAVLDLVAAAVRGAGAKPIGVCGEAAGDPLLAVVLAGLGVTSLSMAEARVPAVRYALSLHTRPDCRAVAALALQARDAQAARMAAAAAVNPDLIDML